MRMYLILVSIFVVVSYIQEITTLKEQLTAFKSAKEAADKTLLVNATYQIFITAIFRVELIVVKKISKL